jgi:hypothetical protein
VVSGEWLERSLLLAVMRWILPVKKARKEPKNGPPQKTDLTKASRDTGATKARKKQIPRCARDDKLWACRYEAQPFEDLGKRKLQRYKSGRQEGEILPSCGVAMLRPYEERPTGQPFKPQGKQDADARKARARAEGLCYRRMA